MADPRAIVGNKSSSLNLQTRKNSSPKKPYDQAVNYFNAQNLLNKNQATGLARDAVANKMSGAVALGATATFPTASPKLPTINLSVPKSLNALKLNPITLGASALLYSSPLGGDSLRSISPNLRLRISDDASTQFEKRVGDKWQGTGVSAKPVFDKHFELVAFQGLSQKDANLIGLPTTFPIQHQTKPMGGFEPSQIKPLIETYPANKPEMPTHTGHSSVDVPNISTLTTPITDIEQITILENRRYEPGVVKGKGQPVGSDWMREGVRNGGAPIPEQIADKLSGREFANFDGLRHAFWTEVANNPDLSKQFKLKNLSNIKKGNAPFPPPSEQVGGRQRFELHHIEPLGKGGDVYNVDNLKIMTPKAHIKVHKND